MCAECSAAEYSGRIHPIYARGNSPTSCGGRCLASDALMEDAGTENEEGRSCTGQRAPGEVMEDE